ncbi:MAG: stage III sporulation protein AA [Clostridia bacterium]
MNIDGILKYFPQKVQELIKNNINDEELEMLEEIRVRNNLPLILKIGQAEKVIDYKITTEDINYIFQKICENSIYSYQKQIANGFITVQGGNRVGIVGTAVLDGNDKVINFNYISGLNFRISRQIIGCSNQIVDEIFNGCGGIYNTLIISKPGIGKTTLLRDIVRNVSNGMPNKFQGMNVAVIDERGEISATYKGIMQNDLGMRTDVINDIPKYIGMKMAIRSMSPKVIVADEVGNKRDSEAIKYAMCCGVKGIFTAHGASLEELEKNPEISDLLENKIFEKIICIKDREEKNYNWSILQ